MMPGAILSLLLALLTGMATVTLLWPRRPLRADLLMKVSLATGLGLGVTSCLSFVYLVISGGRLDGLPIVEIIVLTGLLTWTLLRHPRGKAALALVNERGPRTIAAPVAALAVFLMGAASFAQGSVRWPHGGADAFGIWNFHACFLYRGSEHWNRLFSQELQWSHPDYPLMLPASILRSWVFAGGETVGGPILIAFVFMTDVALTLFSGLASLRGTRRASLAAVLLLGTPFFARHAALQYADVPLAFFYLATLVLLCLAERDDGRDGFLALAGLTCGLAAWTKNEGLLFMASLLLAKAWASTGRAGIRSDWRWLRPLLGGLLPILAILLFFKLRYALPSDIIGSAGRASAGERALTPSRYLAIAEWLFKHVFTFGKWDELKFLPISPLPLLLGALALFGIQPDPQGQRGPATAARALGLTLAGYLLIFLITPHPLDWQLETAGDRLLLQLWPSALFVFFMVIRIPHREYPV